MHMLCGEARPEEEQSVGTWHRDFYPQRCAPLDSYANDIYETGPRYIQWNLSLYDDEVLWVVPGSHVSPQHQNLVSGNEPCYEIACDWQVRRATPDEDTQLRANGIAGGRGDCKAPLPHAVQAVLKAGDGVAYCSPAILHWGSRYNACKRRTLHGGYAVPGFGFSEDATPYLGLLSPHARACFERWEARHIAQIDAEEAVLRAALTLPADSRGEFAWMVDAMVPGRGAAGRAHSVVLLSKAARRIFFYHHQDLIPVPHTDQHPPQEPHNTDLPLCTAPNGYLQPGPVLYSRFSKVRDVVLNMMGFELKMMGFELKMKGCFKKHRRWRQDNSGGASSTLTWRCR